MFNIYIKCPRCNGSKFKVIDKRNLNDTIRRRRKCLHCDFRFTTYEFLFDKKIKINVEDAFERVKKFENEIEILKSKLTLKATVEEYEKERKRKKESGEDYLESIMKEDWGIDD